MKELLQHGVVQCREYQLCVHLSMEQLFQLFVEKILLVEIVEEKMIDLKIEQQHWDLDDKIDAVEDGSFS